MDAGIHPVLDLGYEVRRGLRSVLGEVRYGHGGTAVPLSPVGAAGRGRPALCAVSGGLDSMCLLDLLDRWCRERDGRVVVAHFNHRLRGAEADRDETFVRDWCAAHDIAFVSSPGTSGALWSGRASPWRRRPGSSGTIFFAKRRRSWAISKSTQPTTPMTTRRPFFST